MHVKELEVRHINVVGTIYFGMLALFSNYDNIYVHQLGKIPVLYMLRFIESLYISFVILVQFTIEDYYI